MKSNLTELVIGRALKFFFLPVKSNVPDIADTKDSSGRGERERQSLDVKRATDWRAHPQTRIKQPQNEPLGRGSRKLGDSRLRASKFKLLPKIEFVPWDCFFLSKFHLCFSPRLNSTSRCPADDLETWNRQGDKEQD